MVFRTKWFLLKIESSGYVENVVLLSGTSTSISNHALSRQVTTSMLISVCLYFIFTCRVRFQKSHTHTHTHSSGLVLTQHSVASMPTEAERLCVSNYHDGYSWQWGGLIVFISQFSQRSGDVIVLWSSDFFLLCAKTITAICFSVHRSEEHTRTHAR